MDRKLYFPKTSMMVDENDRFVILINKGSNEEWVKPDPFYGIGIFTRLNVRTSN